MSTSPTDQERDRTVAMYDGFLADLYGADLGTATKAGHLEAADPAGVEFSPAAESGAEYDQPAGPDVCPGQDVIATGDSAEQSGGRRPADVSPVDLDAADPGEPPSPPRTEVNDPDSSTEPDGGEIPLPGSELVDQLTTTPTTDDAATEAPQRAPRYSKRIAAGFVAATATATLIASGALLAMRSDPHTSEPPQPAQPNTRLSVLAAPSPTTPAPDNQDSTIPYTATAVGCLPGSTAAQSVAGPDSTQAWVCVTGGNVGQYLVLNLGRSMVVTAVSITPGWVGADASGADQWHQHRVLTRVQWSFNDTPPTVVPQETGSVHGEATKPMPARGVLASRIILLVQDTGRAPADTAPATTSPPGGGGGLIGEVLGPPAAPPDPASTSTTAALPGLPADQSRTDPADNTFAVSSIKIFGHPPQ
ncbi:hypothetical protein MOKP106_32620 [Mycobacterium avium subsp. hominissuis]|uniref:hypothetical protein n=1 Tax=Mycobacterium avium TaxID=1764 RepID=UPI000A9024EA|nr:hypothetical protein [Mycobacterium avium]